MLRILGILLMIAVPAQAGSIKISPELVIGTITHDWNGDAGKDRAILFEAPEDGMATLALYLSPKAGKRMQQAVVVPEIAWIGNMWGQQPSLSLNKAGSLIVTSLNEGCCRTRWEKKLTIAFRNGRFVVAGFTYTDRDAFDLDNKGFCDVNFLSGRGEISRGGKPKTSFKTALVSPLLSEWKEDMEPQQCFPE